MLNTFQSWLEARARLDVTGDERYGQPAQPYTPLASDSRYAQTAALPKTQMLPPQKLLDQERGPNHVLRQYIVAFQRQLEINSDPARIAQIINTNVAALAKDWGQKTADKFKDQATNMVQNFMAYSQATGT